MAKIEVPCTAHRPVGKIEISVPCGRALLSRDLGIPGQASCILIFDPFRYAAATSSKMVTRFDKLPESLHEIGITRPIMSADPEWDSQHFESFETRRLKQLLRHYGWSFPERDINSSSLVFPVLQPVELRGNGLEPSGRLYEGAVHGWETSSAGIVVQVRLGLAGFDQVLGEVVFPLSHIIERGEIRGWFQVLEADSTRLVPLVSSENPENDLGIPRVLISLKWTASDEPQYEMYHAIPEELVKSSTTTKQSHFDLVGSSIGVVKSALGKSVSQCVQM